MMHTEPSSKKQNKMLLKSGTGFRFLQKKKEKRKEKIRERKYKKVRKDSENKPECILGVLGKEGPIIGNSVPGSEKKKERSNAECPKQKQ